MTIDIEQILLDVAEAKKWKKDVLDSKEYLDDGTSKDTAREILSLCDHIDALLFALKDRTDNACISCGDTSWKLNKDGRHAALIHGYIYCVKCAEEWEKKTGEKLGILEFPKVDAEDN